MFNDTDVTIFVSRLDDGSIHGVWTVRQSKDQEEMLASDPAVVAFQKRDVRTKQPLTDGKLADLLVAKSLISRAEVDAAVAALVTDAK